MAALELRSISKAFKTGKVLEVDRCARKVTVEGGMVVKRHTKPNPSQQIKGGIADKPMPIDASNVMVLTAGGIPTRVDYKLETVGGKARRTRIARKGGETLDRK